MDGIRDAIWCTNWTTPSDEFMTNVIENHKLCLKIKEIMMWIEQQPFSDGCIAIKHEDLQLLPKIPAVYMISGDSSLYIGQTSNLRRRFISHKVLQEIMYNGICHISDSECELALSWDDFSGRGKRERLYWERTMILENRPIYNRDNYTLARIKEIDRAAKRRAAYKPPS
jgi:hypothetical protein